MVWVVFAWVSRLLQHEFPFITTIVHPTLCILETNSHAFAHIIFALSFGSCTYNLFHAITLNPSTCPTPKSDAELKSVGDFASRVVIVTIFYIIEDLASKGRLNRQTFCIQCMVSVVSGSAAICATNFSFRQRMLHTQRTAIYATNVLHTWTSECYFS